VWRGTLDELAQDRVVIEGDGPSLIVIGSVAALALVDLPAQVMPAEGLG
jgi:siroheme synthase